MQPDYSISYMSNPFFHLKGLGFTSGVWEEWEITPKHVTGGNKTVRYTKLEIEVPDWLEQLTQPEASTGSYPPPSKTVEQPAKPAIQAASSTKSTTKPSTGLLHVIGKMFGRHTSAWLYGKIANTLI